MNQTTASHTLESNPSGQLIALEPPRLKLDIVDFYMCYLELFHNDTNDCIVNSSSRLCNGTFVCESEMNTCCNTVKESCSTDNLQTTCECSHISNSSSSNIQNETVVNESNRKHSKKRHNPPGVGKHVCNKPKKNKQLHFKNQSTYVGAHSKRRSLFTRKNSNKYNPEQFSMQMNFPVLTFHTFVLEE